MFVVSACEKRERRRRRRRRKRLLFDWSGPRGARRKRRLSQLLSALEVSKSDETNKWPARSGIRRRRAARSEYINVISDDDCQLPVAKTSRWCQAAAAATRIQDDKTLNRSKSLNRDPNKGHLKKVGADASGYSAMHLIVLLILSLPQNCVWASSLSDYDGATFYKAPVGSGIRIACNGSRLSTDDQSSVSLILWFKNSMPSSSASPNSGESTNSEPIYTVDARQRPLNGGARHFVADAYKGRAKFVTKSWPPYLDLSPLEPDDQAEYRCRIDYRSKPRENFLIILFVLVPPKSVQIMDSSGRSLEQIYGPLSEGSDLTLVCLSKGGRPAPALTWKRGSKVIDDSYLTLNDYFALKQSERLWPSNNHDEQHPSFEPSSSSRGKPPVYYEAGSRNTTTTTTTTSNDDNNLRGRQAETSKLMMMMEVADNNDDDDDDDDEGKRPLRQRRRQQTDSISANPSLLVGQLRSLTSEWRSLAEFQYFQLNESSTLTSAYQTNRVAGSRKLASAAGTTHTPAGAITTTTPIDPSGQSATELLTLPVDESITTAANVLKVIDLAAAAAAVVVVAGEPQVSAAIDWNQQKQQLECLASNLHYDLRTLIKLFAPPSLLSLPPSRSSTENQQTTKRPTESIQSKGRQLAEAIERALDANLLSIAGQPAVPATIITQTSSLVAQSFLEPTTATATANQNNSEAAALHLKGSEVLQQQQPAANGHSKDDKQASIIYQQLSRPHQLASDWLQQQQQQRDPLERSRLIELDVYTRPVDVRISPAASVSSAFSAGQLAEFTCTSGGSRPPAKLSWLKNNQPLPPKLWHQMNEPLNGSSRLVVSHSKVTLKLERQDHGSKLSCRAENEHLTRLLAGSQADSSTSQMASGQLGAPITSLSSARILEDSRTLIVNYSPRVQLQLGNNILSSSIREGTDIYFVCQIVAQPAVREITWLHNERQINSQQQQPSSSSSSSLSTSSVIISNNSLVLQRVKREQRGQYSCMASNSEGLSESNRIELRVLHAPVCSSTISSSSSRHVDDDDNDRKQPYFGEPSGSTSSTSLLVERKRIRLHSRAKFVCQMEANPVGELHFSWFLNNTLGQRQPLSETKTILKLQQQQQPDNGSQGADFSRIESGSSQLEFQPESGLDYGQIYCEAHNSIGPQSRACLYEISQELHSPSGTSFTDSMAPANKLQEDFARQNPLACLAVNVTSNSAWIGCERSIVGPIDASIGGEPTTRQLQIEIFRENNKQQFEEANLNLSLAEAGDEPQQPKRQQQAALFLALTNLRHSSNYLIRLGGGAGQVVQPAEVQFSTETGGQRRVAEDEQAEADWRPPSVQLVTGSETHRAHLMSSLISVRSTNGQSAASSSGEFGGGGGVRWPRLEAPIPSLTSRLFDSLADTFNSLFRKQQLPRRQQPNNHLMDLSDTFLLTSLACVALFLMLALSLLLLHRYSSPASRRDRSSSSLASSSNATMSPIGQQQQQRQQLDGRVIKSHDHQRFYNSHESPAEKVPLAEHSPLSLSAGEKAQITECQSVFAYSSGVVGATATLDMRKLASRSHQSENKTTCAPINRHSHQLYYSSSASESSPLAARVGKSRSSMCLSIEATNSRQYQHHLNWLELAPASSNANNLGQQPRGSTISSTHLADLSNVATEQQQQQQHYHLELDSARLISDANSPHLGHGSRNATSAVAKCQDYERRPATDASIGQQQQLRSDSLASGDADHRPSCSSSACAVSATVGNNLLPLLDLTLVDSSATNLNSLHRLRQQQQHLAGQCKPTDRYAVLTKRQLPACCQSAETDVTCEGGLAFDENQVQFIELLPTTCSSSDQQKQHSANDEDDSLMIQPNGGSFIYEANSSNIGEHQYLSIGQANHLQLINRAGTGIGVQQQQHRWFTDEFSAAAAAATTTTTKRIPAEQQLQLKSLGGRTVALGNSSLASSSLASSSLNDQAISTSPLSSSQTNTTPSNSNIDVQHQDAKAHRSFFESSASGVRSANDVTNRQYYHHHQQQQQQRQAKQGILKNTIPKYDSYNERQNDSLTYLCEDSESNKHQVAQLTRNNQG